MFKFPKHRIFYSFQFYKNATGNEVQMSRLAQHFTIAVAETSATKTKQLVFNKNTRKPSTNF